MDEEKKPSPHELEMLLPTEGAGHSEMKQLYGWTFDEAWEAHEAWEAENGTPFDDRIDDLKAGKITSKKLVRGPFFRWQGAQELVELYEVYRAGNRSAIIDALYVCSLNSLPIPYWCEMAFLSSYRQVTQFRAKSWDDVFGRPHKKGTHLATKRQDREKSLSVYYRIKEIKRADPSIPIDGFLFEKVGKEFGIGGKTLTEEYYYKWKNKLNSK
ncbi:hypothetical protein ACJ77P_08190 [Syntrophus buswellii]|uniref:hypothetical protein n=1 Tax=Syntrophus buswellii TaxID=43774 RepID=UPI0038D3FAB3